MGAGLAGCTRQPETGAKLEYGHHIHMNQKTIVVIIRTFLKPCTSARPLSNDAPRSTVVNQPSTAKQYGLPTKFISIYRWPTMRLFKFVSRLKIIQVGTMALLLPVVSVMYYNGHAPLTSVLYGFISTTGSLLVLGGLSFGFSRVVGELGYCQDSETVCLSTLTFMGRRHNAEINLSNIVPFHDCNRKIRWFQRFEIVDQNGNCHTFYYSLKHGNITNADILKNVLKLDIID